MASLTAAAGAAAGAVASAAHVVDDPLGLDESDAELIAFQYSPEMHASILLARDRHRRDRQWKAMAQDPSVWQLPSRILPHVRSTSSPYAAAPPMTNAKQIWPELKQLAMPPHSELQNPTSATNLAAEGEALLQLWQLLYCEEYLAAWYVTCTQIAENRRKSPKIAENRPDSIQLRTQLMFPPSASGVMSFLRTLPPALLLVFAQSLRTTELQLRVAECARELWRFAVRTTPSLPSPIPLPWMGLVSLACVRVAFSRWSADEKGNCLANSNQPAKRWTSKYPNLAPFRGSARLSWWRALGLSAADWNPEQLQQWELKLALNAPPCPAHLPAALSSSSRVAQQVQQVHLDRMEQTFQQPDMIASRTRRRLASQETLRMRPDWLRNMSYKNHLTRTAHDVALQTALQQQPWPERKQGLLPSVYGNPTAAMAATQSAELQAVAIRDRNRKLQLDQHQLDQLMQTLPQPPAFPAARGPAGPAAAPPVRVATEPFVPDSDDDDNNNEPQQ